MRQTLLISHRVIIQLIRDKRLLALSFIAPLITIYFLKLLLDTLPDTVAIEIYAIPLSAFILHFSSFILCAMLIVQEQTRGTLDRMFISGFSKTSIIAGYTLGYFWLATVQTIFVLFEIILLFNLSYSIQTLFLLFLVIWLLAIVSIMLGIFISTFAKHEGHVIPFIPLIILPSVFLTGLIMDQAALPIWGKVIGTCLPLHFAVNIIHEIIKPDYNITETLMDFGILILYALGLLWLASLTLRESE